MLLPSPASLAALVWLCATASPSEACKTRHQTPFERFDVAATVAPVRVQVTPAALATSCREGTALAL